MYNKRYCKLKIRTASVGQMNFYIFFSFKKSIHASSI